MKNLLPLLGALADESQRLVVAGKLAKEFGAEELIVFVKDEDIDILLPAAGFPQTLQDSNKWYTFIANSIGKKLHYGTLSLSHQAPSSAVALAHGNECVLVLLGGNPAESELNLLRDILPLLSSTFQLEQHKKYLDAQLKISDISLVSTQEMAHRLDSTRRELYSILTQYRSIFESTSDAIMILNFDGDIVEINPASYKMYGYTYDEMIKLQVWDVIRTNEPYEFSKYINSLKKDKNFTVDGAHVKKDGTRLNVEMVGSGLTYKGQPHLLAVVRDVSERKAAEESMRREYETKQNMELLTKQHNALMKVNKTKDEFISLASHQLRTPATIVKQYIALIMGEFAGPLTPDQLQYLQIAYDSNERELTIINDLLKTARIDSSTYHINKTPTDIVAVVQGSVADLEFMFEAGKQTVVLSKPRKAIVVSVDPIEIKLVFMNLLENASKYSYPHSEIKVTFITTAKYVEIAITDTGVGINKENQQRIFEKFTRVDNELSDTVTGTGLGLYWVKRIVEEHDGSVILTSKLDKGSKFTVKLPL